MSKIISIHSYRGGTGKSNITANIAASLLLKGKRVAVVDTDIQSPGIHVILGVKIDTTSYSLNDYLWGKCEIEDTAAKVNIDTGDNNGELFLVPSSTNPGDIARIINDGYNVDLLSEGLESLCDKLNLDYLLIDTHPGLNEETLLSIAVSDKLFVVMRPDQQDFEGTSITLRVATRLKVPEISILINKVPQSLDIEKLNHKVENTYGFKVEAIIPHDDDLMSLASSNIFILEYLNHPITDIFSSIIQNIIKD